jgi:hypothetical protein
MTSNDSQPVRRPDPGIAGPKPSGITVHTRPSSTIQSPRAAGGQVPPVQYVGQTPTDPSRARDRA